MTPAEIAVILRRLDEQDRTLERIEVHTSKTNGRVLRLELWQARVIGALSILSLLIAVGIGIIGSHVLGP